MVQVQREVARFIHDYEREINHKIKGTETGSYRIKDVINVMNKKEEETKQNE